MKVINKYIKDGKYSLHTKITKTKNGLSIYLGGGEEPHIGTVVISQPRKSLKGDGTISCTSSVFNLVGHKDDGLALPLAEELCRRLNLIVVVTAGIHIDGANEEDLQRFSNNLGILLQNILYDCRMLN